MLYQLYTAVTWAWARAAPTGLQLLLDEAAAVCVSAHIWTIKNRQRPMALPLPGVIVSAQELFRARIVTVPCAAALPPRLVSSGA